MTIFDAIVHLLAENAALANYLDKKIEGFRSRRAELDTDSRAVEEAVDVVGRSASDASGLDRSLLDRFATLDWQSPSTLDMLMTFACSRDVPALRRKLKDKNSTQSLGSQELTDLSQLGDWYRKCFQSIATVAARESAISSGEIEASLQSGLPIESKLADIRRALDEHQVVIVEGETGSGKTTQIPKLLLQCGYGLRGKIGHTQPRRLAARTVASRLAQELHTELGAGVGYQFRFETLMSEQTRVALLTDGLLLASIARDKLLLGYDAIVIDEAHERSLNIDFLMGYIKTLLPKRPELKIVITSATIDTKNFSRFFNNAPIISVAGRSYPVAIEYKDIALDSSENALASQKAAFNPSSVDDLSAAVTDIVDRIEKAERKGDYGRDARDILIFLPGEREIKDLRAELSEALLQVSNSGYEIIPLYARLPKREQEKLFRTDGVRRRIVLATNVAETSITVPGIGYVIDPGLARISRFSLKRRLQRLQIEKVSQASANQRAGRCGRVADGVCFRLYSEEDFLARDKFTDPEIMRTQLADVILQMIALGLGDVYRFPFIDKPDRRQFSAGIKALRNLRAIPPKPSAVDSGLAKNALATTDTKNTVSQKMAAKKPDATKISLTKLGRQLAKLPVDSTLGSMLLSAKEKDCLAEVLVIVSALNVVDPREWPEEKRQHATQMHKRFEDKQSDFMTWLNLWVHVEAMREQLSSSQFRKMCKKEFLSWPRLREWRNSHRQILLALDAGEQRHSADRKGRTNKRGVAENESSKQIKKDYSTLRYRHAESEKGAAEIEAGVSGDSEQVFNRRLVWTSVYEPIHRALAAGLYHFFGRYDREGFFRGPHNLQFFLFPGTALFKSKAKWVLASEIVETKKVYARSAAKIEPTWLVDELKHLLKFEYAEAYWHKKRDQVLVPRSSHLYGITLRTQEPVACKTVDPILAREVFIREALVGRALGADARFEAACQFWSHNESTIELVIAAENKLRKKDVAIDESLLERFYAERLPDDVCDRRSLLKALKRDAALDKRLQLDRQDIGLLGEIDNLLVQFPDALIIDGNAFALSYLFSPSNEEDGVSCSIPAAFLPNLSEENFHWLVPGLLVEKIEAMIRLLPKPIRRRLVPVPAVVQAIFPSLSAPDPLNMSNRQAVNIYSDLVGALKRERGVDIDPVAWRNSCEAELPPFYSIRINVLDEKDVTFDSGRNFSQIKNQLKHSLEEEQELQKQRSGNTKATVHRKWPVDQIGFAETTARGKLSVNAFPVLRDVKNGVVVDYELDENIAFLVNRAGVLRLASISLSDTLRYLKKNLLKDEKSLLGFSLANSSAHSKEGISYSRQELIDSCARAAIQQACFAGFLTGLPPSEQAFQSSIATGRAQVTEIAMRLEEVVYGVAAEYYKLMQLREKKQRYFPEMFQDIDHQINLLLRKNFIVETDYLGILQLPRFFAAIVYRVDRIGGNQKQDAEYCEKLSTYQQKLQQLLYQYPEALIFDEHLRAFRWLLEELRVALFAQQLKTKAPASFQRLDRAWDKIDLIRYRNH